MAKPLNVPDKWRAPIGAFAYVCIAAVISTVVCLSLVYVFAVRPQNHTIQLAKRALTTQQAQGETLEIQAAQRQQDTNTIANALCISRIRSLQTYNDKHASKATRLASLRAADGYEKIIQGLSPHPPTQCKGVDPKP